MIWVDLTLTVKYSVSDVAKPDLVLSKFFHFDWISYLFVLFVDNLVSWMLDEF